MVKAAMTLLNFTDDMEVKLVPVIVTFVPPGPLGGLNPVMPGETLKIITLKAVPFGVTTETLPLTAPDGTIVNTCVPVSLTLKSVAATLLVKRTAVAPWKFDPFTTTGFPTAALSTLKLVIFGETLKKIELVAVPATVVTVTGPVVAPSGTAALIEIDETETI